MAEKRSARRWFREHWRREMLTASLGGVAMIPATIAAHYLARHVYLMITFRFFPFSEDGVNGAITAAWVMVAVTYPLYWFLGRERVEEAHGPGGSTGTMLHVMGPGRIYQFLRLCVIFAMLAPAATMFTFHLFSRWRKLAAIRPDDLAEIFSRLWKEEGKVPSKVLFADFDVADTAMLADQLRLFDGINRLPSGEPGYAIGSELRQEIREWKRRASE